MDGILLLIIAVLGGVGLFLAMPGGKVALASKIGALGLAGAGAALAFFLARHYMNTQQAWFIALGGIGLIGAVRMITHSKPVYSALYFILVVVSTTGLALLAQAEFLAAAVLIIYAGAILVTYVFVIMLAQQTKSAFYDRRARGPFFGCLVGFVLLGLLTALIAENWQSPTEVEPQANEIAAVDGDQTDVATDEITPTPNFDASYVGGVEEVATHLMTTYVVGLQVIGIVLLAAMVGAIAIARRQVLVQEEEVEV